MAAYDPVRSDPETGLELVKTVPVVAENYSISKKPIEQEFIVEKRWTTKMVSVPVKYEEIYVNGKRVGSELSLDTLVSSIANAAKKDAASSPEARKQEIVQKGEPVPLLSGSDSLAETLPLYGEKVVISKKMIRYGEAVLQKRRVTENKTVKITLRGEKVIIRYPDGTERTVESTAPPPQIPDSVAA